MQKRNIFNSPRLLELKKRRRKAVLNKILIFLLGLAVVVVFLSYISRIDKLNIDAIEIIGNKVLNAELLKETVQKEIAGHYLWIFPKTNIFFYPKNNIQNTLHENFKRLKDITLSIKDRKILAISVTERVSKYTWCGDNLVVGLPSGNPTTKEEKCYFLDETGYIFDEAPYFSGEVYFKFYGLAGSYFSEENFKKFILFKETLEIIKLKPVALYMLDNGNVKVYLSNESSLLMGPEIIFKVDADVSKIAENLQVALSTEPLQTDFKKKYSSLLYIDLRFGNKVYYKFQ